MILSVRLYGRPVAVCARKAGVYGSDSVCGWRRSHWIATNMTGLEENSARDRDDARTVEEGRADVLRRMPRGVSAQSFFGGLIRRAIDEVLTQQSMRYTIDQLDPPEQTYIGTRVEILVREGLDLAIGERADAIIADRDADIKWSKSLSWMIGPENLGTLCLGLGMTKDQTRFSVGLFVPHKDHLGGQNRDKKYGVGAPYRRAKVAWIVEEAPLEQNFIATLSDDIRERIMRGSSAQERVRRLAELVPNRPIPRSAIRFVTNNKEDFMRRIREDSTRSAPPLGEMVCLSWKYRKSELSRLGIALQRDQFIFVHQDRLRG